MVCVKEIMVIKPLVIRIIQYLDIRYKGEALDKKTPLLRSMEAISTQGLRIVRLFGNDKATKVIRKADMICLMLIA